MSHGMASRSFSGPADGLTVTRLRSRLRDWLGNTVAIDTQRECDIVLAAGEALANCAEHAYRGRAAGTMTLTIVYDPAVAVVEVLANDDGRWMDPAGVTVDGMRGRGLPLMKALADDCVVEGHPRGTTVRLRFANCPARDQSSAQAT